MLRHQDRQAGVSFNQSTLSSRRLAPEGRGLFREPGRVQDEPPLPMDCFDECALFVFHKSYLLIRALAEEFRF